MVVDTKPLAEITEDALRVLYREIGLVNTVRFISQFTVGFGDYTEERRRLFQDMTLEDIVTEIRDERGPEPPA
ncbi:MAG: hypothetical protein ACK2VD_18350 [Anaerolineae bacterium]|jgi:hypothetical protein